MIDRIANEVAIQCMDCGIITDIRQFKDIPAEELILKL